MIYYVEDDDNIRELVVYTLRQVGMDARGFAEGRSFRSAMNTSLPDLVLLDMMLPDEDGMTLLRQMRADARTQDLPVIMVTAKDTEFDKVQGLEGGADDYITKPFGMAELVARIRARLRRVPVRREAEMLQSGGIVLDQRAHRVHVDGEEAALTLKEYELLRLLMENKGAALSRDMLLEKVWGITFEGGTRTVDVHIQTLRSKLDRCGHQIETVRGVGYRITV